MLYCISLSCWDKTEQKQLNCTSPETTELFVLNLDESLNHASKPAKEKSKDIGSAKKRENEKNLAVNQDSITTVRIGSAWGSDGAREYLAKGKTIEHPSMIDFQRILRQLRDVQIGAIIDQCSGKKAQKAIAKRRVDFVAGNIDSYARILNGPAHLESICSFNKLAASVPVPWYSGVILWLFVVPRPPSCKFVVYFDEAWIPYLTWRWPPTHPKPRLYRVYIGF